jgi:hypothetical protein
LALDAEAFSTLIEPQLTKNIFAVNETGLMVASIWHDDEERRGRLVSSEQGHPHSVEMQGGKLRNRKFRLSRSARSADTHRPPTTVLSEHHPYPISIGEGPAELILVYTDRWPFDRAYIDFSLGLAVRDQEDGSDDANWPK